MLAIMSNWSIDYHHAQLLRLLSMVIVFGVLWPSLCLVFEAGSRLARRVAERATRRPRITRGQMT